MKSPWQFLQFIRELRAEKFAIALPLSSHIPSFTSYLIARLSGAQIIEGYDTRPFYGGATWSQSLTHIELQNRPEDDPEWVKFMELVRPLGADGSYEPEFETGSEHESWARQKWAELKLPADRKKIGIFFGGNPDRPERLWPPSRWRELVLELQRDPNLQLIGIVPPDQLLSGSGAREQGVYSEVAKGLEKPLHTFSDRDLGPRRRVLKRTRSIYLRRRRPLPHRRGVSRPHARSFLRHPARSLEASGSLGLRPASVGRPAALPHRRNCRRRSARPPDSKRLEFSICFKYH